MGNHSQRNQQANRAYLPWYKSPSPWLLVVVASAITFAIGWFLPPPVPPHIPLRLGGYKFISPLLACNFNATNAFPPSKSLDDKIAAVIDAHKSSGDLEKASVYVGNFGTGQWANVNGDETYYPSSLGKVPIMMAYFSMAENSSTLLNERVIYPTGQPDLNAEQEIKPEATIIPGESYTVEELIQYMVKYSDNNAAALLFDLADQDVLKSVYSDLQVPFEDIVNSSTADFMTPRQYAVLFRTLYNSTYLSRTDSEKALSVLSQTSFTQGIVAGVPSSTIVSHKYGLVSYTTGGVPYEHELHDCGIVYGPSHPYLICVMTRGNSSISALESSIADISRTVYQAVETPAQ